MTAVEQKAAAANLVLMRQVAVPSAFEKLAADFNVSPDNEKQANDLLNQGDLIKAAVDDYLSRQENQTHFTINEIVKEAVDTGFDLAGWAQQPQPISTPAFSFLNDDAVRQAAMALSAIKKAEEECDAGMMGKEEGKTKPPASAVPGEKGPPKMPHAGETGKMEAPHETEPKGEHHTHTHTHMHVVEPPATPSMEGMAGLTG